MSRNYSEIQTEMQMHVNKQLSPRRSNEKCKYWESETENADSTRAESCVTKKKHLKY